MFKSILSCVLCAAAAGCMDQDNGMRGTNESRPDDRMMNKMSSQRVDRDRVEQMIANWPQHSKMAAMEMMQKYGPPNEATASHLMWWNNGPWKWTKVSSMEIPHDFPMHHPDLLEQAIDYRVPPDMFDDLAMYDGSVICERTKGEISARCDKEGANFLALNLANEIVTGKRSVNDARTEYARQIKAMMAKQPAPLTERLMFSPMKGNSGDPDRPAGM